MTTFASFGVVDKVAPFKKLLEANGYQHMAEAEQADLFIVDINWKDGYRDGVAIIQHAHSTGKPIFMVPHGAKGYLFWDSVYDVDYRLTGMFVPGEEQKDILEKGGFPVPIHVTGFPWSTVKPYKPKAIKNVLFAPIHAGKDGSWDYAERWNEFNKQAWQKVLPLSTFYDITVFADKGFTEEIPKNIKRVESTLDIAKAIEMIDEADMVIAQETLAHLALAAGKQTVMFDDTIYVQDDRKKASAFWEYYRPYPVNILEGLPVINVLNKLMIEDQTIRTWRDRYIGWNFNENTVLGAVERSLK